VDGKHEAHLGRHRVEHLLLGSGRVHDDIVAVAQQKRGVERSDLGDDHEKERKNQVRPLRFGEREDGLEARQRGFGWRGRGGGIGSVIGAGLGRDLCVDRLADLGLQKVSGFEGVGKEARGKEQEFRPGGRERASRALELKLPEELATGLTSPSSTSSKSMSFFDES
jgi:hypothetical protein